MSKAIDVHCITMPGETVPESLRSPLINVHRINAKPGNVLVSRTEGFLEGDAPYVSFIDPDDEVIGDPFSECLNVIKTMPFSVVYTNSILENGNLLYPVPTDWSLELHRTHPAAIHQVAVMRRDMVESALRAIWQDPELVKRAKMSMEMHLIYAYMVRRRPAFLLDTVVGYKYNNLTGRKTHKKAKKADVKFIKAHINNYLFGENDET